MEVTEEKGGRDDGSGGRSGELGGAEETKKGGGEGGPQHERIGRRVAARDIGMESV